MAAVHTIRIQPQYIHDRTSIGTCWTRALTCSCSDIGAAHYIEASQWRSEDAVESRISAMRGLRFAPLENSASSMRRAWRMI
jgi:hypothetical protein